MEHEKLFPLKQVQMVAKQTQPSTDPEMKHLSNVTPLYSASVNVMLCTHYVA